MEENSTIDLIADWALSYLEGNGSCLDQNLHWNACHKFLSRDEIMIGGSGLDDFSEKYDEAVNYLRSEYFITLDADDKWKTHERKKKKSKKLTVIRRSKDKISCLYIIEFEEGCKIGISSNVKNRMRDYKKPWCKRIERSYIVHHESPLDVENHLKRCFKDVRHRGEFYYCEPSVFFRELEAAYPMNPVENFLH